MIETIKHAVSDVVNGLRENPLSLALIVLNVVFLLFVLYVLMLVAENAHADRETQNKLIVELARACMKDTH